MTARDQLLREIEQAPNPLVEEVLNFLLFVKSRRESEMANSSNSDQLKAMASDPDIQNEIKAIEQEFALTERDGLS